MRVTSGLLKSQQQTPVDIYSPTKFLFLLSLTDHNNNNNYAINNPKQMCLTITDSKSLAATRSRDQAKKGGGTTQFSAPICHKSRRPARLRHTLTSVTRQRLIMLAHSSGRHDLCSMRLVKYSVFNTHKCRFYYLEAATQTSIRRHRAAVGATTAVSRHYWPSGSPVLANYVTHFLLKILGRPYLASGRCWTGCIVRTVT